MPHSMSPFTPHPRADNKPFTQVHESKGGRRRKGRTGKKDSTPGKDLLTEVQARGLPYSAMCEPEC